MTFWCHECGKGLKLEKALECKFCGSLDEKAYCFRCYSNHLFPVHLSLHCRGKPLQLVEEETEAEKVLRMRKQNLCPLCTEPFNGIKDLFFMGNGQIRICHSCGEKPNLRFVMNRVPRTGPCYFCDERMLPEDTEPLLFVFLKGLARRACKLCHEKGIHAEDWKDENCYYCDRAIFSIELMREPYYVTLNGEPHPACKHCHSNGKLYDDWSETQKRAVLNVK